MTAGVSRIRQRLNAKMMDEKNMPPPPAPDDNDDEEMTQEDKVAIERAGSFGFTSLRFVFKAKNVDFWVVAKFLLLLNVSMEKNQS